MGMSSVIFWLDALPRINEYELMATLRHPAIQGVFLAAIAEQTEFEEVEVSRS